jgi:hypothetical protein
MIAPLPFVADVAKNCHGSSATYEKSGYGIPPVSMSAMRPKKKEKTSISITGVTSTQATPRTACL